MDNRITDSELLDEYRGWVDKNIPLSSDWLEEIEYLTFLRGQLHDVAGRTEGQDTDTLRAIDKKWQLWAIANTSPEFSLESGREDAPKSQWWMWIDRLGELTEEERSTI